MAGTKLPHIIWMRPVRAASAFGENPLIWVLAPSPGGPGSKPRVDVPIASPSTEGDVKGSRLSICLVGRKRAQEENSTDIHGQRSESGRSSWFLTKAT